MTSETIQYSDSRRDLPLDTLINLYGTNHWSSAEKPELLRKALSSSHSLVTAGMVRSWSGWVMHCPMDLWSHTTRTCSFCQYQGHGIGMRLMQILLARYVGFHHDGSLSNDEELAAKKNR
jgi:hypothetical protein